MNRKEVGRSAALITVLAVVMAMAFILTVGCAAIRKDAATGQPPRQPTPIEQALATNVRLATVNNYVTHGIVSANTAGLVPDSLTATVLRATDRIAEADTKLSKILERAGTMDAADAAQVRELVQEIKQALSDLGTSGGLGIKNPQSQQTFQQDLLVVGSLADGIVDLLKTAGVLK